MAKRGRKRKNKIEIEEEFYALSPGTKKGILIVFLFALAIISILSFLQMAGTLGNYIDTILGILFGLAKFIFPLVLICLAYVLLRASKYHLTVANYIGIILFVLGLNGIMHLQVDVSRALDFALAGEGGGLFGLILGYPALLLLGQIASYVILIAITLISILLMFNTTLENLLLHKKIPSLAQLSINPFGRQQPADQSPKTQDDDYNETDDTIAEEVNFQKTSFFKKDSEAQDDSTTKKFADSKFKKIKIDLPINLLENKSSKPRSGDIKLGMERIESTLRNFGINVEMHDVSVGPTVTQFTLKPADGVKLSKITTLSNDLALALAAHPIRIEAPIPGKSLVGIEVPNQQPATVTLRQVLEAPAFKQSKSNLTLALGKDVSGKCWSAELSKMPHLLVAGATGSGKSVCLNGLIISLLYQNNPDMMRLILVDPKRVEFTVYNGIPHLLTPVITDVTKTVNALRWTIQEMDKRYDILAKAGARNIASYNQQAQDKMPYIIFVVDELADLMVAASAEIETSIIRLTQMARAVGIHLILATQRPSVDVITGLIKANIPARVAFSVASSMDSRTILDSTGAEKLLGKGDMLFQTADMSKPKRLQGAFVSDNEIKKVVDFLKQAGGEPEYDDSVTDKQTAKTSFDMANSDDSDELYNEAKEIVIQAKKASASLLQRRLRIGYARAARLIDMLEDNGIVSAADGARPRDVLVTSEQIIEQEQATPTIFKTTPDNDNGHDNDSDSNFESEDDNDSDFEQN